jgi:hypothetical protein
MLKDKTLKEQTSDHFSIDDLEFFTELNSQQAQLASGGWVSGYWSIDPITGNYIWVEPDYVGALLDTYPSDPIGEGYRPLTQEELNYLDYLGGIFGFDPTGRFY